MTTLPAIADALQPLLSTIADQAGLAARFIQRPTRSELTGSTFVQALVFGWLDNPDASLEELSQTAAAVGVTIRPQGIDQRFTEAAATCLRQVLTAALMTVWSSDPGAVPLLQRFSHVGVQDCSTIVLPDT